MHRLPQVRVCLPGGDCIGESAVVDTSERSRAVSRPWFERDHRESCMVWSCDCLTGDGSSATKSYKVTGGRTQVPALGRTPGPGLDEPR